MQLNYLLPLSALAASATAGFQKCASGPPDAQMQAISERLGQKEALERNSGALLRQEDINVGTYVHVIAGSEAQEDGALSDETVRQQMDVLNERFASSGVSFDLLEITRTINKEWVDMGFSPGGEIEIKTALRKGDYTNLNVYIMPLGRALGVCYQPKPGGAEPNSTTFIRDGCLVDSFTVPGGSHPTSNLGLTAVHEVGHWMGLFHTFQPGVNSTDGNGCSGEGDFVDDTPASRNETEGCPIGRNSCPDLPGLDPIHNYMDYSDDDCVNEFTPGQTVRMHSMWNEFRKPFGLKKGH